MIWGHVFTINFCIHPFNPIGRKATVTQALGATVQDAISYSYNDAGQVLAEAHTAGLLSGLTVANAYNSLLQRTSLVLKDSGGTLHSPA